MHAVNNGPAGSAVRATGNDEAFARAGIPYARNHDASFYSGYGGENTVDVHRIFRDFSADEQDPASYDFRATDACVKRTLDSGTKVFYRLGAAIEHGVKRGTYPPADFEKWARICEHIILHYNEGWADGYRYGIEYWEIWNEPDCKNADGSNPCWQGSEEEFIEFFCTALAYLKGRFPSLRIGGPAFCRGYGDFQHALLREVKRRGLPLDFYSYHCYKNDPEKVRFAIDTTNAMIEECGLGGIETVLNEWNYVDGWLGADFTRSIRTIKGLKGASYTSAVMCIGQEKPLDMLMYYDARPCTFCGMFNTDLLTPLKGYYPFLIFGELYRLGECVSVDGLPERVYGCAARGEQGGGLMLTYFDNSAESGSKVLSLEIELGPGRSYTVEKFILDESSDMESVSVECIEGGGAIELELGLNEVVYYRFARKNC